MATITIYNSKYVKGGSKFKFVHLWLDKRGKEIWCAMIDGSTKPFDTERAAAIFVDKHLIRRKKEPVNILVRI